MKIISFYTPHYEWDAKELISSMQKLGIDNYEVEPRDNSGNWVKNTQIKAPFILEKLQQNDAVVWTDADSRILKQPELFDQLDCDVAFHFMERKHSGLFRLPDNCILKEDIVDQQGYLQSGTMYFKNTPKVIHMLELWCELNEQDRSQWDQWTLQFAMNSTPDLNVYRLPPEYVWIDSVSIYNHGELSPVIYHTQASRRFKNTIH